MERIIDNEMLKSAQRGKSRAGKKDLIKHLKGQKLTRSQAIKAKCYDCLGMGESCSCDMENCVLWPFSQFGGGKHRVMARKSPEHAIYAATEEIN